MGILKQNYIGANYLMVHVMQPVVLTVYSLNCGMLINSTCY